MGFPTAGEVPNAFPDKAVISITGDGDSSLRKRNGHGSPVRHQHGHSGLQRWRIRQCPPLQKELYDGRIISTDLVNPDFVALAESYGAAGLRVHSADNLRDALTESFEAEVPVLIEVPVGEMPGPWRRMYPAEVLFRKSDN